jgi:hypothetical protein
MPLLRDLRNQVFGRLTVLSRAENDNWGRAQWFCRCICGQTKTVPSHALVCGDTQSCGCLAVRDVTNQVFGRLTPLRSVGRDKKGNMIWLCRCSCNGKEIEVSVNHLKLGAGGTNSCGCLRREKSSAMCSLRRGESSVHFKHGHCTAMRPSPTYTSWRNMLARCLNPNSDEWCRYGGANPPVKVCNRWHHSFEDFLADMGPRSKGTSLGRFGDVGNYEPGNCSWQTMAQQMLERKIKRWNAQLLAIHGRAFDHPQAA